MTGPVDVLAAWANDAACPLDEANRRAVTYAAVAELVEALKSSDEWVRAAKEHGCKLPCENTLANNRAALAKFGGG